MTPSAERGGFGRGRALMAGGVLAALGLVAPGLARQEDGTRAPRGAGGVTPVASAQPGDRVVLLAGPLLGVVEPCRCTDGMLGGLPRRASLLARFGDARLPLLELGDLGKPTESSDSLLELRTRGGLEALATLRGPGTHAIALGCTEVRLGLERLARLAGETGSAVVFLATNLRPATGTLPGAGLIRARLVDGDLVVLAVLDPDLVAAPAGFEVVEPRAAVAEALAALPDGGRGKRVVVLFHGEAATAERALGAVAGLAVVAAGHGEAGGEARRLASGAWLLPLEAHAQRLHAVALGPEGLRARASHPLDGLLPDAAETRAALDAFYERAARTAPEIPRAKLEGEGGTFVGSATCRDCHAAEAKTWAGSGHAHALERLREKDPKRAALPECVVCHVTGLGLEGGFRREASSDRPDLGHVGCESCHGVGSAHGDRARAGQAVAGFGRPPGAWPGRWRERCLVCHDPENSPGFDLEGYLEKIRHWKKGSR